MMRLQSGTFSLLQGKGGTAMLDTALSHPDAVPLTRRTHDAKLPSITEARQPVKAIHGFHTLVSTGLVSLTFMR
jgi:hypothetical protein